MNPDRFERLKEILLRIVDRPEAERKAILDQACGGDLELRAEVEDLLEHDWRSAVSRFIPPRCSASDSASSGDEATVVMSVLSGRFAPGQLLGNRYRIDRLLGRGGMGEVYCAQDLDLGVPVALKTIRPEIAADPVALRRFKQEVLLARSVTHPNVCRIYDHGRHRDEMLDVSFLTMEFLPGETLATRIRSTGLMSRTEALPIARQLAEALDAAHRAGIVHGDFKSANVQLVPSEEEERAVVTDFGLAVGGATRGDRDPVVDAVPPAGPPVPNSPVLLGTPAYMAPEQVRGERIGPAADLYAFGVVLFEMATGALPFSGNTPLETARLRLLSPPPPPSTLAEVDPEWEAAILRLLSVEPEARFTSAGEAVAALEGREIAPRAGPGPFAPRRPLFHLPAERDVFVGRTRELGELADRLEGGPAQVTVLGAGGTGKTRLARRYGWTSLERWPGGVWLCDLTEARSADGVAHAVATGLDVPLGKGDPIVQLGHAIAGRGRALIILDNFEQVAEHAEATLGRWVARARETSFLATSRERLQLEGETVLELDPLETETEGIELFAERARAQRPDLALTGDHRAIAAEIVRLVDGLPLAIELAAARLRTLSLEQLRARLVDRLGLLVGPKRGRQGTLRATLDWSWELLESWEQAAVAEVSVFEGGFTLEAAEAVLDVSGWPAAPAVLDVVQALVDKSWLRARSVLEAPRFEMYATVREYAAGRLRGIAAGAGGVVGAGVAASLPTGPASQQEVEKRHGSYYALMGTREALEALDRHGGVAKRAALRLEIDNLVTACRRAVDRADPDSAVGAFVASWTVLNLTGPTALGVTLGQTVTEIPGIRPAQRAWAALNLGRALQALGRVEEARRCFEESLALHREMGDRRLEGAALLNLGILDDEQNRTEEARRCYEEALAIHREVGNRGREGAVLNNLGLLHLMWGREEEARRLFEEALAIHREVGNRRFEGVVLANLGSINLRRDQMEEARRHFEEALAIFREVGDQRFCGMVLGYLGVLHANQGQMEEAGHLYQEALAVHREVGNRRAEGAELGRLGDVDAECGRLDEAQRHLEEALAIDREIGARALEGDVLVSLGALHGTQGRREVARRCFDEGIATLRAIGDRFRLAKALCSRCEVELQQASVADARPLLAEAETIVESLGIAPDVELPRDIARLRQALANEGR